MEHPSIAMTNLIGYAYPEPDLFSKCEHCGEEIFNGEDYIDHAGYIFHDIICAIESLIKSGLAERKVAGQ